MTSGMLTTNRAETAPWWIFHRRGITGNDHFMFQDLNNDVIADHIENWIQENVK